MSYFHFDRISPSQRKIFFMSKNGFNLTNSCIEKMKTFMKIIQTMGKNNHNMMTKKGKKKAKY